MDQTLKEKWIDALRSGNYDKTTHVLCSTVDREHPAYCCLGVLLDISGKGEWVEYPPLGCRTYRYPEKNVRCPTRHVSLTTQLNPVAREDLGIDTQAQDILLALNDSEENDFHQIADWIEENL